MIIKFSLDGIKNMDILYTWTKTELIGCEGEEEHYHGTDYCKSVVKDVRKTLPFFSEVDYSGQRERIANETFVLKATDIEYSLWHIQYNLRKGSKESVLTMRPRRCFT